MSQQVSDVPTFTLPYGSPDAVEGLVVAPVEAPRPLGRSGIRAARRRRRRRRFRLSLLAAACAGLGVAGVVHELPKMTALARVQDGAPHGAIPAPPSGRRAPAPQADAPRQLPDLGPHFAAAVPANARQALVVVGEGPHSWNSTATLWLRAADGTWHSRATWWAHNALRGWTARHHEGDLHSPIGVFTLTAAGGRETNPGTALPYTHSAAFQAVGDGFEGEPLAGAFDYVIAIDYNHVPGSSPLDPRQPLGPTRGQGLWVHVDHRGPTHGCVSLPREDMISLLRTLDPADHPVIVMGDRAALAH